MAVPERARVPAALALAALAACAGPWRPFVVDAPEAGLPADVFERCRAVLAARYRALTVADMAGFRLQTDWTALAVDDLAAQQRATVFRHGPGIGLLVEVRYLQIGWFDTLPSWSEPRPDRDLESELGALLATALH
jgi:hypothetical protein